MEITPSSIATHYYKIGHIKHVQYSIYTHENDQSLLELELTIRHKYPNILITYYNKCLYHFKLDKEKSTINMDEWSLILKSQGTVSVDAIANPKSSGSSAGTGSGGGSTSGSVGGSAGGNRPNPTNGSTTGTTPPKEENETFLSVSLLKAIKKSVIYKLCSNPKVRIFGNYIILKRFNTNHVIHLDTIILANGDILVSAIENNDLNLYDSKILKINEITNGTYNEELNSNFVIYLVPSGIRCHLFDSLKILNSFTTTPPQNVDTIKELVRFCTRMELKSNVWVKLIPNLQHLNNQTSKIAKFIHEVENKKYILWPWDLCVLQFGKFEPETNLSNPVDDDLIGKFLDFKIEINNQNVKFDEFDKFFENEINPSQDMNLDFDIDLEIKDPINIEIEELDKPDNDEDLFGDESDLDIDNDDIANVEPETQPQSPDKQLQDVDLNDVNVNVDFDQTNDLFDFLPMDQSIFDIPKDQMTYDDPGAPLPIIPTPRQTNTSKSSFSPIVFNPLIKSNIDTKYGKGGKFYVARKGNDTSKLRATSVSGAEIRKDLSANSSLIGSAVSDSESESDEDEDEMLTPLKLNDFPFHSSHRQILPTTEPPAAIETVPPNDTTHFDEDKPVHSSAFSSPNVFMSNKLTSLSKFESPFSPDRLKFSPLDTEDFKNRAGTSIPTNMNMNTSMNQMTPIFTPALHNNLGGTMLGATPAPTPFSNIGIGLGMSSNSVAGPTAISNSNSNLAVTSSSSGATTNSEESSNCLPLILRGINVSTIPEEYLLNNIAGAIKFLPSASDFEMVDEDDEDGIFKKSEMIVNNLDFLEVLTTNLVFDLGLNEFNFVTSVPPSEPATEVFGDETIDDLISSSFTGYRIKLDEFLSDLTAIEMDQFSFLDELTNDEMDPKSKLKKLESIEWDTFENEENFHKYKETMEEINDNKVLDVSNSIQTLPENKIKAKKSGEIVNLNATALNFWKFLNFQPDFTKDFKVILVSEVESEFLSLLQYNYHDCNLGKMDILEEIIVNGDYRKMYKKIIKKLESIELPEEPILLLFVNFNDKMNSILQISKISQVLKGNVFVKILPSSAIFHHKRLKYLSSSFLTTLNLNLFNICPPNKLFTNVVKDPLSKVAFKFFPKHDNDTSFDDAFLHLAYERSIDKQWLSVAWSDPTGLVTKTKSWKLGDLKSVSDEVFDISVELFKILNDEIISRTNGLGGKKFLVLTRLNSVIPDDELVHWKRLSLKYKDISLIVLSVSGQTRNTFSDLNSPIVNEVNLQGMNNTSNNASGGTFSPFSPYSFLSPDPKEVNYKDMVIQDCNIISLIPQSSVPSFNCPTRVGMKLGLLVKKLDPGYEIFEVNLLSCSNYWNVNNLMKLILNHYKKMMVLGDILGVGNEIPWHIAAVNKSLRYLVHIEVET
ncbi:mediator of RNA polymerase II transcription subunit 13 [[Candida] jaroonii]|uniref:Mediator of RNA polymerase II transcription subunit 13 n=1 Tax=[Candida] jaroonii TaxID=467808 RepID=A0ACA9Y5E9_9ASCO|nr:mediator of RNA polymerase II transcription subunit 13 [[Candida] jaroonii]